jgi:hypothetical protein
MSRGSLRQTTHPRMMMNQQNCGLNEPGTTRGVLSPSAFSVSSPVCGPSLDYAFALLVSQVIR